MQPHDGPDDPVTPGSAASAPLRIGDWTVWPDLNRIARAGEQRLLEPRAMDLLVFLARHAGTTCSREQILDGVWGTRALVDGVVTKTVSDLRRALDDDVQAPVYVQTVSRRGYRLIAATQRAAPDAGQAADRTPAAPHRRQAVGTRLGLAAFAAALVLVLVFVSAWVRRDRGSGDDAVALPAIGAIGVRSFVPLGDNEHAYLAHGIAEQLAIALAQGGTLRVYGPAARDGDGWEGAQAAVDAVLAGSLWQQGGRLRLGLHLSDSEGGRMLWAWQRDFTPAETFTVVAEAVNRVARAVGRPGTALPKLDERGSHAAGAYLAYVRARELLRERGREDLLQARDLFADAVASDPDFALAHAGLAETWLALVNYRVLPRDEGFRAARAAAEQAMALDADLPESNRSLGWVLLNADWNLAGAQTLFERATALDPGDASGHQLLAECLSIQGKHEAAAQAIERALDRQPGSPLMQAVAGLVAHAGGRHEDALVRFERAARLEPRFTWLHRYRADALVRLGRRDAALAARLDLVAAEGATAPARAELAAATEAAGLDGYWRWQLRQLERQQAAGEAVEPSLLAEAAAANGEVERPLALVERIVVERGEYFLQLRHSPAFDRLRSDPRYRTLLARAGLDAARSADAPALVTPQVTPGPGAGGPRPIVDADRARWPGEARDQER